MEIRKGWDGAGGGGDTLMESVQAREERTVSVDAACLHKCVCDVGDTDSWKERVIDGVAVACVGVGGEAGCWFSTRSRCNVWFLLCLYIRAGVCVCVWTRNIPASKMLAVRTLIAWRINDVTWQWGNRHKTEQGQCRSEGRKRRDKKSRASDGGVARGEQLCSSPPRTALREKAEQEMVRIGVIEQLSLWD